MMEAVLRIEGVSKYFNKLAALTNITFSLRKGSVVGLLGINGAGKTTLLRILTGTLLPNSGEVWVAGVSLQRSDHSARRLLGYVAEVPALYAKMTIAEYLAFVAGIKGFAPATPSCRRLIAEVGAEFELTARMACELGTLSRGYRQRISLAAAVLGDPPLLLLDEPSSGLDPKQANTLRKRLLARRATQTILFSSHLLSEVEAICDEVKLLHRGKLQAHFIKDHDVFREEPRTQPPMPTPAPYNKPSQLSRPVASTTGWALILTVQVPAHATLQLLLQGLLAYKNGEKKLRPAATLNLTPQTVAPVSPTSAQNVVEQALLNWQQTMLPAHLTPTVAKLPSVQQVTAPSTTSPTYCETLVHKWRTHWGHHCKDYVLTEVKTTSQHKEMAAGWRTYTLTVQFTEELLLDYQALATFFNTFLVAQGYFVVTIHRKLASLEEKFLNLLRTQAAPLETNVQQH